MISCILFYSLKYYVLLSNIPLSISFPLIFFSEPSGCFLLAFARRNVPIDKVLAAAETRGLAWQVLDEQVRMEPIYRFTWPR
jgi:hypothetical protein